MVSRARFLSKGDHSQTKETAAKKLFIPTLIFFTSPFMCTWMANSILPGMMEICFIAEQGLVWESWYIRGKRGRTMLTAGKKRQHTLAHKRHVRRRLYACFPANRDADCSRIRS